MKCDNLDTPYVRRHAVFSSLWLDLGVVVDRCVLWVTKCLCVTCLWPTNALGWEGHFIISFLPNMAYVLFASPSQWFWHYCSYVTDPLSCGSVVRMVQPAAEGAVEQGGCRCRCSWFVPLLLLCGLCVAVSEEGRCRGLMYKPVTKLSPV